MPAPLTPRGIFRTGSSLSTRQEPNGTGRHEDRGKNGQTNPEYRGGKELYGHCAGYRRRDLGRSYFKDEFASPSSPSSADSVCQLTL